MDDRELLILAAKAAQLEVLCVFGSGMGTLMHIRTDALLGKRCWDPLNNDGDALRLAIKLHIDLVFMPEHDSVVAHHDDCQYVDALDDFGTRRTIVRAAAEIGKSMPELTK